MGHWKNQFINFILNNFCNLRCKYCYEGRSGIILKDTVLNLDFAKKAFDDFILENPDVKTIKFFGGEPFLAFTRMSQIREYAASKLGKDLKVIVQTNAYYTKDVCEWIVDNIDMVWVSCDGPPDINDTYRVTISGEGTSQVIERNLRYLVGAKKPTIGVRVTIGEKNVKRQKEIIDYFLSLGVRLISVYPIFKKVGTNGNIDISPDDFAEEFYRAFCYAREKGVFYSSLLISNFDEEVKIACRAMIPNPHLTPDGFVSACEMACNGNMQNELIYGKYDEQNNRIIYDKEKILNIRRRNIYNLPECKGCDILKHCAGGCVGEALNESGSITGIKRYNCQVTKKLFKLIGRQRKFLYFNP